MASHDQGPVSSSCLIVYVTIARKHFISSNQIFCCPKSYNDVSLPHFRLHSQHLEQWIECGNKNVKWSVILDNAWRDELIPYYHGTMVRKKEVRQIIEHNWFIDRVIICKQVQTIISNVIFLLHLLILSSSLFFCPSFWTIILNSNIKDRSWRSPA